MLTQSSGIHLTIDLKKTTAATTKKHNTRYSLLSELHSISLLGYKTP